MARNDRARELRYSLLTATLRAALMFLFVREQGSNRGQAVETFLKYVGARAGDPWCAAFVSYVLAMMNGPLYKGPRTASCDVLLEWARRHGILHDKPERGDLFLVMRAPHDATHVGFVEEVRGREFDTIEGNTNGEGSREGDGAYRRVRGEQGDGITYAFIRWIDAP